MNVVPHYVTLKYSELGYEILRQEMITLLLPIAIMVVLGLLPPVFAQSDNLSSVLGSARKSLDNKSIVTHPTEFTVPSNANLWTRIQLEPHSYIESRYVIPSNSSFNFSPGSGICPENPCEQEFFEGVLRKESFAPNKYFFAGTLKIIDKSIAIDPDIKNWVYYPFTGEFLIESTKENIKTGDIVEKFRGDLGFDKDELKSDHAIQYAVTGIFEQPSNTLTLIGRFQ